MSQRPLVQKLNLKKKHKLSPIDWTAYKPAPVVGVDEAGRGCLAGPVFAGAVILSPSKDRIFRDSKILSEARRETLFEQIQRDHIWAVGIATVDEIAEHNILRAALIAMRRAVLKLKLPQPGHLLVDGKFTVPGLDGWRQTALIKGDLRAENISAASIVAKVCRDRWMKKLSKDFPQYEFELHKGYGTARHLALLAEYGPCSEHRLAFKGVLPSSSETIVRR